MKLPRALTLAGAGAAGLYLSACAAVGGLQRSMLYHPQPPLAEPDAAVRHLEVEGARLRLSVRSVPGPRALIYFGGNAENVAANLPDLARTFPDRALYLLHYRGFGGSTGNPTEAHLHADARVLFDAVHAEHPDVLVVGRSLGSGVAVRLASERPVSQLVLVTPYDSIEGIAVTHFPWLPVRWMLVDKFESWRYAPRITAPTLVLAAETDAVVPRWSTDQLIARFAPGVARMQVVIGANHNNILHATGYGEAMRAVAAR